MSKRTQSYGLNNPLQDVFPVPVVGQRSPTANDVNYEIGQMWVDQTTSQVYGLTSVSSGEATWSILGPGSSDVDTLTGDTGGALSPTAGNINILGGDGISVDGSESTLTVTNESLSITPYVVGPAGKAPYQTIQSALDATSSLSEIGLIPSNPKKRQDCTNSLVIRIIRLLSFEFNLPLACLRSFSV